MKLHIGTSGFSYPHWSQGIFYPKRLPENKWLAFYSNQFNAIELNVTFYRLPDRDMTKAWQKNTPKEFSFVLKGSRFITHIKRLKDVAEPLQTLWESVEPLKAKIACFLWQLPPGFKLDMERLTAFCALLSEGRGKDFRHVFEFRDQTWFCEDVYKVLKEHNYCLCFADSAEKMGDEVITADFAYLRFHGGSAFYNSNYSRKELEAWVAKVEKFKGQIKELYAFFNNDEQGFAIYNAQNLRILLLEQNL